MIQIPEPPTRTDCATCGPLTWLYSARKKAWVAFIPDYTGGEHAIRPHPCRFAQDPATWRSLPSGSPPSAAYLAAKAALAKGQERTEALSDHLAEEES